MSIVVGNGPVVRARIGRSRGSVGPCPWSRRRRGSPGWCGMAGRTGCSSSREGGPIRVYKNNALLSAPFLDLRASIRSTARSRGCWGWRSIPNTASTAASSSATPTRTATSSWHAVSNNPDVADAGSALGILTVDLPSSATDYAAGSLEFGPDGLLYIGVGAGDGGLSCNPGCVAQQTGLVAGQAAPDRRRPALGRAAVRRPDQQPVSQDPNDGQLDELWAYGLYTTSRAGCPSTP